MSTFPFNRIVVIGSTASGRSTLAQQLADRLGLKYVELDALYWQPGWKPPALPVFRQSVQAALALAGRGWVVDGNYHVARDIIWPAAELVVWLDYSLPPSSGGSCSAQLAVLR